MTQRHSGPYIQIGCGCLLLVALLLGTVIALLGKNEADHFWDDGIRVEGGIDSIDSEISHYRARDRIVSETVHFWYPVGKQTFHHFQKFSYNTAFYEGQPVTVIYLPDTPWTAEILMNTTDEDYSLPFFLFGPLTAIVIAAFLRVQHDPHRKEKRKPHTESFPYDAD